MGIINNFVAIVVALTIAQMYVEEEVKCIAREMIDRIFDPGSSNGLN